MEVVTTGQKFVNVQFGSHLQNNTGGQIFLYDSSKQMNTDY